MLVGWADYFLNKSLMCLSRTVVGSFPISSSVFQTEYVVRCEEEGGLILPILSRSLLTSAYLACPPRFLPLWLILKSQWALPSKPPPRPPACTPHTLICVFSPFDCQAGSNTVSRARENEQMKTKEKERGAAGGRVVWGCAAAKRACNEDSVRAGLGRKRRACVCVRARVWVGVRVRKWFRRSGCFLVKPLPTYTSFPLLSVYILYAPTYGWCPTYTLDELYICLCL